MADPFVGDLRLMHVSVVPQADPATSDAGDLLRPYRGRRVLLAKEPCRLRQLLCTQINQWRLRTVTADSWIDAFSQAIDAKHQQSPFDLLLIDDSLPDFETPAQLDPLRDKGCQNILVLTSQDAPSLSIEALGVHFLPKPYGPEQLAQALAVVLAQTSSDASA